METLTPIGLIAIAALLFYRWVSPAHKRVAARTAVVIVVIAAVVLAIDYAVQWRRTQTEKRQEQAAEAVADSITASEERRRRGLTATIRSLQSGMLTIELCNQDSVAVRKTELLGWGLLRGRSTKYSLLPSNTQALGSTQFSSDLVVAPRSCANHHERVRAGIDSVEVVVVRVEYADDYNPYFGIFSRSRAKKP